MRGKILKIKSKRKKRTTTFHSRPASWLSSTEHRLATSWRTTSRTLCRWSTRTHQITAAEKIIARNQTFRKDSSRARWLRDSWNRYSKAVISHLTRIPAWSRTTTRSSSRPCWTPSAATTTRWPTSKRQTSTTSRGTSTGSSRTRKLPWPNKKSRGRSRSSFKKSSISSSPNK